MLDLEEHYASVHPGNPEGSRRLLREYIKRAASAWTAGAASTIARAQPAEPVFVLSLKAGGTRLNLTAANHVIHYDRWWNPAVEDQATDRASGSASARTSRCAS